MLTKLCDQHVMQVCRRYLRRTFDRGHQPLLERRAAPLGGGAAFDTCLFRLRNRLAYFLIRHGALGGRTFARKALRFPMPVASDTWENARLNDETILRLLDAMDAGFVNVVTMKVSVAKAQDGQTGTYTVSIAKLVTVIGAVSGLISTAATVIVPMIRDVPTAAEDRARSNRVAQLSAMSWALRPPDVVDRRASLQLLLASGVLTDKDGALTKYLANRENAIPRWDNVVPPTQCAIPLPRAPSDTSHGASPEVAAPQGRPTNSNAHPPLPKQH